LRKKRIKIKKINPTEISSSGCAGGCPGSQMQDLKKEKKDSKKNNVEVDSELQQWPVQLNLLPSQAPFFENTDLLVCADCVPFACANFHQNLLKGKSLVIGCPKLDDITEYEEKLSEIFKNNNIKTITVAIMEVPCCYGMYSAVESAIKKSGKEIKLVQKIIGVRGENK
jgi:hypothetical protein